MHIWQNVLPIAFRFQDDEANSWRAVFQPALVQPEANSWRAGFQPALVGQNAQPTRERTESPPLYLDFTVYLVAIS